MRSVHKVTKMAVPSATMTSAESGAMEGGGPDVHHMHDDDHNNSDPIETSSVFSTASRDSADTGHNITDDDSGIISRSMH